MGHSWVLGPYLVALQDTGNSFLKFMRQAGTVYQLLLFLLPQWDLAS